MRSDRSADDGQDTLPFEVAALEVGEAADSRPARRVGRAEGPLRHRITSDALASRGLPAGTEVTVAESGRRPVRGDVVLVRSGEQLVVGLFDLRFGRAVLRWDRGGMWLGPTTEVLGIVTAAAPPLAVM